MKKYILLLILPLLTTLNTNAQKRNPKIYNSLFHYSTADGLLAGTYEGSYTVKQLKQQGDFGLGTFNHLNGEMIVNNGVVYHVPSDGKAVEVADSMKIPFAAVCNFKTGLTFRIDKPMSKEQFEKHLDSLLGNENKLYAIRITGYFAFTETRSNPPMLIKPSPPMAEFVKQHQKVFNLHNRKGTCIGFRIPGYLKGINIPGYHFHYLDITNTGCGHLLNYAFVKGVVEVDVLDAFQVQLTDNPEFYKKNLNKDRSAEVKAVE